MNEFAALLYDKVNNLEQEGLKTRVPYAAKKYKPFFRMWKYGKVRPRSRTYNVLLFFFYADRVFKGLDTKKRQNWVGIFRKKQSYVNRLSSLLQDPNLINKQPEDLPGQYYL
jgi:hypothetical protein